MNIHEYQGKQLFKQFGVNVLENRVCKTADEAAAAFDELGGPVAVVKSQIHAGGRGKGTFKEQPSQHGVQLVKSAEEAKQAAANMLGNTLVTIQTGEAGKTVNQIIVEAGCDIATELYLGVVLDRENKKPVLMCSQEERLKRFSKSTLIRHRESKATKFASFAPSLASPARPFVPLTNS